MSLSLTRVDIEYFHDWLKKGVVEAKARCPFEKDFRVSYSDFIKKRCRGVCLELFPEIKDNFIQEYEEAKIPTKAFLCPCHTFSYEFVRDRVIKTIIDHHPERSEIKLVGLSLSRCIKDMVEGKVEIEDVICIVTGTMHPCVFDPERIASFYKVEWSKNFPRAIYILTKLIEQRKIIQPRQLGLYPPDTTEGWWAIVGK